MGDVTLETQRPGETGQRSNPPAPVVRRRRAGPSPVSIRRLPLASLRVFVAVGDHLNFTRAADSLGVTAGAASMQIRALEQYLRVSLFRRNGRHVVLTREGTQLLPKVRQGLVDLERALDEVRTDRDAGPLRLTTLASFLAQWLLPRLDKFTAVHPRLSLELNTSSELVDFVKTGMHAGVRLGSGRWPGLHVEKLLDEWLVPVCRPALLKKLGPVTTAADLRRYRLLHSSSEPWTDWLLEDAAAQLSASGMTFDDSVATLRAAESGQALALSRWSIAAKEIEEGSLAIASPRAVKSSRAYYFVCPPRLIDIGTVVALRDWLVGEARKFEATVPFGREPHE